jgi:glycosyltransferase involved in cell wall biosynthesis/ribosomal protein S18 acetylase RimI-like enzyme
VVLAITQGLLREGYRVSVLTDDARTQQVFTEAGAGVILCSQYRREIDPCRDMAAVAETVRLCRAHGITAMHTHTTKGGVVGRVAAALLRVPVVHTVHGFSFHEFTPKNTRLLYEGIERLVAPLTTRLVTINEDEQRLVTEGGWLKAGRCVKILNGIPVGPPPPPVRQHQGRPLLVAIGRLAEQKGYPYLLRAMPRVLERYPDARLAIIGDGEDRAALELLSIDLGLQDAVTFTGFQPNPLEWLERAHVAVSSSLWEGLPIAVLEMMAARRPIVATTCRGTREVLVDRQTGLLAPPADAEALAAQIIAMLDNEPRAVAMAEAARMTLEEQYDEPRMVKAYVGLFRQIAPLAAPAGELVVRAIRRADVPAAVRIHVEAFKGFFLTELGPAFLRELYAGFCDRPEGLGYVAEQDGRIVGVVAGTTTPAGFFSKLLLERWPAFSVAALPAVVRRPGALGRVLRAVRYRGEEPPALGKQVALLSSIAVDPSAHGKGLGGALVRAFVDGAAERGVEQVYLTTDGADNDAVNAFYQRIGFTLDGSFLTPEGRPMNRYAIETEEELRKTA